MEPLTIFIVLIVVCLLALLGLYISKIVQELGILFLMLIGVIAAKITMYQKGFIEIPFTIIAYLSIFGMVILSFHIFSQFSKKDFDSTFLKEIDFFIIYTLLTISVVSFVLVFFFDVFNVWHAVLFACLCLGTEVMLREKSYTKMQKIKHILSYEHILSSMFVLLVPIVIILMSTKTDTNLLSWSLFEQAYPSAIQIIIGIGSGIFMGIILLNIVMRKFSWPIKTVSVFAALFLSYFMSEYIGGIGIFATAMMGVFISHVRVPDKKKLLKQSEALARPVEAVIIIALGYVAGNTLTSEVFMNAFIIFALLFAIRFVSFFAAFSFRDLSLKEKILVTLRFPKEGILATLLLSFFIIGAAGMSFLIPMITAIMIYSLIVSLLGEFFNNPIGK